MLHLRSQNKNDIKNRKWTKQKFANIYILTWNPITEAKEFLVCAIYLSKTDSQRSNGSKG